jgi:hypothetical protein
MERLTSRSALPQAAMSPGQVYYTQTFTMPI